MLLPTKRILWYTIWTEPLPNIHAINRENCLNLIWRLKDRQSGLLPFLIFQGLRLGTIPAIIYSHKGTTKMENCLVENVINATTILVLSPQTRQLFEVYARNAYQYSHGQMVLIYNNNII
jgi:hypothetical protein